VANCLQYAPIANPVSPPPSRTGSIVGLPDNVPSGPALRNKDGCKIDRYRSGPSADGVERRASSGINRLAEDTSRRASVGNAMSPRSAGSGGSTPIHLAPTAPSMLPKPLTGVGSRINQQQKGTSVESPVALDSLRSLKSRKQAIAKEAKARHVAQQIDANQVKKERDQLARTVGSLSSRLEELETKVNQGRGHLNVSELQDARKRIAGLEKATTSSNGNGQLHLKTMSSLQQDIEDMKLWRQTQASHDQAKLHEAVKGFILQEVISKTKDSREVLQKELKATETRLAKRMEEDRQTVRVLSSGFNTLDAFRQDVDTRNYSSQLKNLTDRLTQVENNEAKTYNKAKGAAQDIEDTIRDIRDFIGPISKEYDLTEKTLIERIKQFGTVAGQLKTFQSEQTRFSREQRQLHEGHLAISKEQGELRTRLDSLELKTQGPGSSFKKVGTVSNSPTNTETIDRRLGQHEDEIKELRDASAGFQALSTQFIQSDERLKNLEEHWKKVNNLELQFQELQGQVAALQQSQSSLPHQGMHVPSSDKIATDASEIAQLQHDMDELYSLFNGFGETVHNHSTTIDVLPGKVEEIVGGLVDPVSTEVERLKQSYNQRLDECRNEILELKQQLPDSRTQLPDVGAAEVQQAQLKFIADEAKVLKQDISSIVMRLQHESSLREQEVEDVKQQVSLKVDTATSEQQMAHLKFSFRNLQDQYNNITTDDLHQKMVHWFLQNYPNNAAAMVQQFAALQHDLRSLQTLTSSLQQSFHNLNSDSSPFLRVHTFHDIRTQLSTHIDRVVAAERQHRLDDMNALRSSAGKDHELRVKEKNQTKITLDSLGTLVSKLQEDVQSLQGGSLQVHEEVADINTNFIQPNRQYFGYFGNILILLGQMQHVIEQLCVNLPRGGEMVIPPWTMNMATIMPAASKSENANGMGLQ
jgi:hypothetical protein